MNKRGPFTLTYSTLTQIAIFFLLRLERKNRTLCILIFAFIPTQAITALASDTQGQEKILSPHCPICLAISQCLPENWSKLDCMVIYEENQLKLVSRSIFALF